MDIFTSNGDAPTVVHSKDHGIVHDIEHALGELRADVIKSVHVVHHIEHTMATGNPEYSTQNVTLGVIATAILSDDPRRIKATLLNTGSSSIKVGPVEQVMASGGFTLQAGASLDVTTTAEVWAIGDGGVLDLWIELGTTPA